MLEVFVLVFKPLQVLEEVLQTFKVSVHPMCGVYTLHIIYHQRWGNALRNIYHNFGVEVV